MSESVLPMFSSRSFIVSGLTLRSLALVDTHQTNFTSGCMNLYTHQQFMSVQFFTIENNVCCRLIINGLYCVEVVSFYAHFLKSFNHKWVLNFVKGFFCIIEIIIWFLSFSLLIWYIPLIDLHILKNPYIPGVNPT